jgi:hypothetical protein
VFLNPSPYSPGMNQYSRLQTKAAPPKAVVGKQRGNPHAFIIHSQAASYSERSRTDRWRPSLDLCKF